MVDIPISIFIFPWPFWVALTVPTSGRVIEHQYQERHQSALNNYHKINLSSMELMHHVKNYWMMAETGNPQFVIACSPYCSASGLLCSYCIVSSILQLIKLSRNASHFWDGKSDYRYSVNVILIVQSIGILVGSSAPLLRCTTTLNYFNLVSMDH